MKRTDWHTYSSPIVHLNLCSRTVNWHGNTTDQRMTGSNISKQENEDKRAQNKRSSSSCHFSHLSFIFWVTTLCSPVKVRRRFEETFPWYGSSHSMTFIPEQITFQCYFSFPYSIHWLNYFLVLMCLFLCNFQNLTSHRQIKGTSRSVVNALFYKPEGRGFESRCD
jgi:hypothetical protein